MSSHQHIKPERGTPESDGDEARHDGNSTSRLPSSPPVLRHHDGFEDMAPLKTDGEPYDETGMDVDSFELDKVSGSVQSDHEMEGDAGSDDTLSDLSSPTAMSASDRGRSEMPPPPPPAYNQISLGDKAVKREAKYLSQTAPSAPEDCVQSMTADAKNDLSQESNRGASEHSDDPQDSIAPFDWKDLDSRYHRRVEEFNMTENEVMKDFESLCNYFAVWADVGSRHEIDRSFKRLKTQGAFVQHGEYELEQKREHYVKVVNAFKSALDLLAGQ